jgi:hypothetical protein
MNSRIAIFLCCLAAMFFLVPRTQAQPLNGVWRGKISIPQGIGSRSWQVELKLIRVEDSLRGIAYYYQNRDRFARTLVRGYVDPADGTVRWWDEEILDGSFNGSPGAPVTVTADFNCPGEGIMKLDGETILPGSAAAKKGELHLVKKDSPLFPDGWDALIADGPVEGSDIQRILELESLMARKTEPAPRIQAKPPAPVAVSIEAPGNVIQPSGRKTGTNAIKQGEKQVPVSTPPKPVLSIEEKFVQRSRKLVTEIPLHGDTLEINFYDHAEIDGDSISLFMGNHLLKDHILLKASPYTLKFAVKDLEDETELTMVAENLGSIPPNTSLMIAYIDGIRHEARLESTENSSAMIRFIKPAGVKRRP